MIKIFSLVGLIIIFFILTYFLFGENSAERTILVFTEMYDSKAYESFSPNPLFKDGKAPIPANGNIDVNTSR